MVRALVPRHPSLVAILVLALVGLGISGYLTAVHYADRPVYCAGLSSCETVNTSEYAELGGIPIALLGLGTYAVIAALVFLSSRWAWGLPALLFMALTGALYSAYLTWVELVVIDAICAWCVASAVVITLIAALATITVLRSPLLLDTTRAQPAGQRAGARR